MKIIQQQLHWGQNTVTHFFLFAMKIYEIKQLIDASSNHADYTLVNWRNTKIRQR